MLGDIVIVLLLIGGFVLGFVRGSVRQVFSLAAWLVTFVLAGQLARPVANWLQTELAEFAFVSALMVSFLAVFVLVVALAVTAIQVTGKNVALTRHGVFDDVLGGLLGVVLMLLIVSTIVGILDSHYGLADPPAGETIRLLSEAYNIVDGSVIVGVLRTTLLPALDSVLAPVLPPELGLVPS